MIGKTARGRTYTRRPIAERLWSRVETTDNCWLWTGSRNARGYGQLAQPGGAARPLLAHRVSWEIAHGPIPDGLFVLHACDNPPCVRPSHLFLGTNLDNSHDMLRKDRGCRKLTNAQVQEVRELIASGIPNRDIAIRYGVTTAAIWFIQKNKHYQWSLG